jgi:hypothetical protein
MPLRLPRKSISEVLGQSGRALPASQGWERANKRHSNPSAMTASPGGALCRLPRNDHPRAFRKHWVRGYGSVKSASEIEQGWTLVAWPGKPLASGNIDPLQRREQVVRGLDVAGAAALNQRVDARRSPESDLGFA